jgi:hypothetical protein
VIRRCSIDSALLMMSVRQHGNPHWTSLMLIRRRETCNALSLAMPGHRILLFGMMLQSCKWWRRRDSKLLNSNNLQNTEALHISDRSTTIPCDSTHLRIQEFPQENRILTLLEHKNDSSLQKKCALCVHFQNAPPDLKLVADAWSSLPKELRMKIAMAVLVKID